MVQWDQTRVKLFFVRGLGIASATENSPGIGISAIDVCDLDIDVGIAQEAVRVWLGRRQESMKPQMASTNQCAKYLCELLDCSSFKGALFVSGLHHAA